MEDTINLNQLLEIIIKRIKIIFLFIFIGIGVSAIATFFFITPKFSSQAQLVVTLPQTDNANVNEVTSNLQMINTYKDFIVSDLVLNQVEDRLKADYNIKLSTGEIKKSVSVEQNQNSQMFSIVARSPRADQAMYIANTVATIFQENAKDVLNVDRITIISKAVVNTRPVSPNNKINLTIGLIVGLVLGIAFALLLEIFDRTVKDTNFVTEVLDLTVLGTVPEISDKEVAKYIKEAKKLIISNENIDVSQETDSKQELKRRRSRI